MAARSPEQVAADLDQASKLGVEHIYWNSDDDPLSQLPHWNSCVAADGSCGSPDAHARRLISTRSKLRLPS
jgi:hypothetical protein